jgi:hypothetical protein
MADPVSPVLTEIIAGDALGLGAAAKLLPAHRGAGRASPSTLWRWIVSGAKASDGAVVKLEAARVGGRWLTSREALARFAARLTPASPDTSSPAPKPRAPAARHKSSEAAAKKLEAMGA